MVDRSEAWDLLPAYALDAVDDDERRAVDRLLMADADARRTLDELRETVGAFVVDVEPPPGLRADVLARITAPEQVPVPEADGDPGAPVPGAATVVPISRARRRRWVLVAAAAAAVVAVAVPTGIAVRSHDAQVQLQAQADRVAQMLADPDARLVTASVAGGGEASALVSGDDVLFTASGLPGAGEGEDYQLWVVEDGTPVSAGLFDEADSQALIEAAAGETIAMTVEPAGGSEQPTTDPVVALET